MKTHHATDWFKVLCPTRHKIGLVSSVLSQDIIGIEEYLQKDLTQQKQMVKKPEKAKLNLKKI